MGEVEGGAILVASSHENKVKLRVDGLHGLYAEFTFFSKPSAAGRQVGSTVVCPVPAIVNDFFHVGVCILPAVPFALPFDPQQTKVP